MHRQAKLLSLEQWRPKQLLSLMYLYKIRHDDIRRVHVRNMRGAYVYSFERERYNNVKYKNSPYYKGSLIWDTLQILMRRLDNIQDFKMELLTIFQHYDPTVI